jgi:hypothetical protein
MKECHEEVERQVAASRLLELCDPASQCVHPDLKN